MPTRHGDGEGSTRREVIDRGAVSIRRGIGRGTSEERDGSSGETRFGRGTSLNAVVEDGGPERESERGIVASRPGNAGGAKTPCFRRACQRRRGSRGLAMSLTTPDKISSLQRKLYSKAKAEPAYRFYLLYDKIHRPDILEHAFELACENGGAPGVDGVTFAMIEAAGLEEWLATLREELASKTYRPMPVRRVTLCRVPDYPEKERPPPRRVLFRSALCQHNHMLARKANSLSVGRYRTNLLGTGSNFSSARSLDARSAVM